MGNNRIWFGGYNNIPKELALESNINRSLQVYNENYPITISGEKAVGDITLHFPASTISVIGCIEPTPGSTAAVLLWHNNDCYAILIDAGDNTISKIRVSSSGINHVFHFAVRKGLSWGVFDENYLIMDWTIICGNRTGSLVSSYLLANEYRPQLSSFDS